MLVYVTETKKYMMSRLTLKRSLEGSLGLRCDTGQVASLSRLPVDQSSVLSYTVVPNNDCVGLPLDTYVEVGTPAKMLVEEVEDGVGFFLLEADDIASD